MAEERKPRPDKERYNRMILVRVLILTGIFGFAMFVPLSMKLYNVAITQHDELEQRAIDQATSSYPVTAGRGTIYDRNHNILAVSASVETVCVSPRDIARDKDADAKKKIIADGLSALLDVDREMIVERMERTNRANETIKMQIERELADEVRQFIEDNKLTRMVFLEPASKRYYPNGSFASNILGFVDRDGKGLMGLEAVYNKHLAGAPGYTVRAKTGQGMPLPNQYEMYYDVLEGYSLVLTIDETIQHFAEKHLETAVIENEVAQRGCAIVMDVKTGGILAMATKGDFDLNEPREIADEATRRWLDSLGEELYADELSIAQQAQWRNKAVSDTYEPGSVFKIFTAAMAIEEKAVDIHNDRFSCGGTISIPGYSGRCHKAAGHGSQTFLETLTHSCNPAFVNIGMRVGPEKFYDYMRAFGFMDTTGIDLQGEAKGIIAPYENYSRYVSSQAVYSFGQTFTVTPLQMLTAVSAVANGGKLMKPYMLSQVIDADGRVAEKTDATLVRQVISEDTSRLMCEYLEECVNQGTGSNAYVKGYHVAGKTGTSQKRAQDITGEKGLYVVSFAGFAPSHDPQIAVLVMLDEPGLDRHLRMGGYMAAPVAGRIFADALPYMNVIPQYKPEEAMSADVTVPFVKRAAVSEAEAAAKKLGLTVRVIGDGESITDQLPAAGVRVPLKTEMILYTEGTKPEESCLVPDVRGKTPGQANELLTNAGVFMRPIGAKPSPDAVLTAAWQEYAGQEVPRGTVISVEFRSSNVDD
ncbi:MAG: penicillin-binding transpeptidase domain-containing protein [Oscillospiraceae bacterium]|nr:penicillin-binding transpeptidase domain-containing protein [Oscillospiraceae bacterium]